MKNSDGDNARGGVWVNTAPRSPALLMCVSFSSIPMFRLSYGPEASGKMISTGRHESRLQSLGSTGDYAHAL